MRKEMFNLSLSEHLKNLKSTPKKFGTRKVSFEHFPDAEKDHGSNIIKSGIFKNY